MCRIVRALPGHQVSPLLPPSSTVYASTCRSLDSETTMRHMSRFRLLLILSAALFAACSRTSAPPAAADIPKIEFEKYALPNGLEVILSEDHRLPTVSVDIWYHVGPANEAAGRTGFAHLFEHMMFQGSKHVPGDSHFQLMEEAGGTNLNGTTN